MPDANRLLRDYIEAFERDGYADPREFVQRAEGPERARLSALIDGYLEHAAPRQAWDPDAFEGSIAERAVARAAQSWSEASGELPTELVALRNKWQLPRVKVVEWLASSLGVSGKEEKVAAYYHQLEHGLLPAKSVSPKVFDSLGDLFKTSGEQLRTLGLNWKPPEGTEPAPVFARKGWVDPEYADEAGGPIEAPGAASPGREEDWDEVDELFRGSA